MPFNVVHSPVGIRGPISGAYEQFWPDHVLDTINDTHGWLQESNPSLPCLFP